jgi:hypothetical protein
MKLGSAYEVVASLGKVPEIHFSIHAWFPNIFQNCGTRCHSMAMEINDWLSYLPNKVEIITNKTRL